MLRSAFEIDAEEPSPSSSRSSPTSATPCSPSSGWSRPPPPLAQIQTQVREALIMQRAPSGPAPSPTRSSRGSTAAPRRRRLRAGAGAAAGAGIGRPPAARAQRPERGAALLTLFALPQGRAASSRRRAMRAGSSSITSSARPATRAPTRSRSARWPGPHRIGGRGDGAAIRQGGPAGDRRRAQRGRDPRRSRTPPRRDHPVIPALPSGRPERRSERNR